MSEPAGFSDRAWAVGIGARTRARISTLERRLEGEAYEGGLSLDPEQPRAPRLSAVIEARLGVLPPASASGLAEPLASGLADLVEAQLAAFPRNLFWDFEFIVAALLDQAQGRLEELRLQEGEGEGEGEEPALGAAMAEAAALLSDRFARMAELQTLYGRASAINFSYVHDFVYGFDWAKWVAREPALHTHAPGPFSLEFLVYMYRRGHELLALISRDDREYPRLPEAEVRNPFPFSREPEAERRLHAELAKRDLIPVPTWDPGALNFDWSTRWQTPFQARRVEVAAALGLNHPVHPVHPVT